jgi:hypothetical protein
MMVILKWSKPGFNPFFMDFTALEHETTKVPQNIRHWTPYPRRTRCLRHVFYKKYLSFISYLGSSNEIDRNETQHIVSSTSQGM